ncbi:MAG: 4-hydroxy-tetrahydrodipicolinate synthase [Flavobacteriales bacterium]|jgi:4-hydroxy-tetrahydrodipicolinate synthase|nr:4-hydroxy-tetrahydrodipicolinate synthase [Flavobacteriales bacterium]
MNQLKGLGVAMVTPFKKDLTIDVPALKKLTDHLCENGADYLVVMGTTGETPTLDKEDRKLVLETVMATNGGRKPVVLGMGGNNTQDLCLQLDRMDTSGITALLSVAPYYNKPTQNGYFEHYKALSEHSKLPIILYNVPGRTGSNVLADTTLRIAFDCRNVIGIKEASGNLEQIMNIIKDKPKDFMVISGDDSITLPLIAAGADGVISVVGNAFPKEFSAMVHHAMNGEMNEARALHYRLLEITQLLFIEGNPAGVKEVLSHLDICDNYLRLPLTPVSQLISERMRRVMIDEEFIK